jgi:hypothetical protein
MRQADQVGERRLSAGVRHQRLSKEECGDSRRDMRHVLHDRADQTDGAGLKVSDRDVVLAFGLDKVLGAVVDIAGGHIRCPPLVFSASSRPGGPDPATGIGCGASSHDRR